jgi:hypothetical protein
VDRFSRRETMANGFKSGVKDTGSVAPVNTSSHVTRNEQTTNTTFAKGGTTKMFGEQEAGSRTSADKSPSTGKPDSSGPGEKFAEGGKGKMFGYQGSLPARDGITSAR